MTYSHTYSDLIVTVLNSIPFTRYNIFHIHLECIPLLYMNKLLGRNLGTYVCRIVLKMDIGQRMYLSTCRISPNSVIRKRRHLVSVGCVHRHCLVKKAFPGWCFIRGLRRRKDTEQLCHAILACNACRAIFARHG